MAEIPTLTRKRIQSIDLLRGVAMIVMAIDHSRDFIHYGASVDQDPLDFQTTSPALFLSRWVTHFCAPVFVFLSGTSIFLNSQKRKNKHDLWQFLLKRGIWLMLIEVLVIQTLWNFTFDSVFLQVIWAIGLSMFLFAWLQYLPFRWLLAIGLMIVFSHNLLDPVHVDSPRWQSLLWSLFHERKDFPFHERYMLFVTYPVLPWLGIMILGYCAGRLYLPAVQSAHRQKILFAAGITATVLFIILRVVNQYGDTHSWSTQRSPLFTLLDFLKTTKYPPSLLYTLMTLGPGMILLALSEKVSGRLADKIIVFGKVPFFYYVCHVLILHLFAFAIFFATGHPWKDLDFTHFRDGSMPYGSGHSLWVVYAVWMATVLILYLPCRWFSRYKGTHRQWWLSYL